MVGLSVDVLEVDKSGNCDGDLDGGCGHWEYVNGDLERTSEDSVLLQVWSG